MKFRIALALACLACSLAALAADEEEPEPKHRVDFGVSWFDTPDESTLGGGLYYAWAPRHTHSFSAALPYLEDRQSSTTTRGIGDAQLQSTMRPRPISPRAPGCRTVSESGLAS